ncbi:MAG TPA: hypothetical protein VG327_10080 [Mycobacterium sp.]|nr:hypothetical protein [Mycobacterium sp.]
MTVQALVYRPNQIAMDRNGDPIDADGNVTRPESPHSYLGTLDVVFSNLQTQPIEPRLSGSGGRGVDRGEAADISGQVGAPRDAEIQLRHGDRLVVEDGVGSGDSTVWQVSGPRLFDTPNSLTGWGHRLYWIAVLSTVN